MPAKGMVAASSKETVGGMWNVVFSGATAYSAKAPWGVSISWKAATRSPSLKLVTLEPTEWTMPAMSSPWLTPGT
jgi:hypothetical protein